MTEAKERTVHGFARRVASVAATTLIVAVVGAPQAAMAAGLVIEDLAGPVEPVDLAQQLVGDGVVASNVVFTGADAAGGRFTGGDGIIGFGSGITLSSGFVADAVGPNDEGGHSGINNAEGDADLDALASADGTARETHDAAVLEFDFTADGAEVSFDYVFSSEEYNSYVGTDFNDVFGFYVNGTNCATVGGEPVSINTINGGNGNIAASNPDSYVDNTPENNGGTAPLDTEMDGLTVVLQCRAPVDPDGTNHMKLAIADTNDSIFDATVFLRTGSLTTTAPIDRFDDPSGDVKRIAELVCQVLFEEDGAAEVVLARDDVFADTLAGAPLAGGDGCILFTPGGPDEPLDPLTRAEIDRVLADGAPISTLGGERAVSAAVAAELVGAGYDVERYSGAERILTAVEIAREVNRRDPDVSQAVLAFAGDWPDAVTAGAWAAVVHAPVLLTYRDSLHADTAAALQELGVTDTVVMGGTAVVSDAAMAAAPGPTRVSGPNRMGSAVAVASTLWAFPPGEPGPEAFAVVNLEVADGWALALAASPLSVRYGAPQIGVRATSLPTETADYLTTLTPQPVTDVYVLGGVEVVSDAVATQVSDLVRP